jgi:transposase
MDLRRRAMDRLAAGQTSYEVAAALKVAVSSVIKWAARQRV